MEVKWYNYQFEGDSYYLAGDIGGTNSNLAIVGAQGDNLKIILECIFSTQKINSLVTPVRQTLDEFKSKRNDSLKACCISAAGPVHDNYCALTNASWDIDGREIENHIGIRTSVINDFMAISYSLPLLDPNDPEQITQIPHSDGSTPQAGGMVRAVAGAGTGLGIGFLLHDRERYIACPSEGGHFDFAAFDEETQDLHDYLLDTRPHTPCSELLVSGQGIVNIFEFFKERRKVELTGVLKDIDAADPSEKPKLISMNADKNEVCLDIMKLFIKLYGRFAGNLCLVFLPFGGLYLAGGIASKNEHLFLEHNLFMRHFESEGNHHIRTLLNRVPVYIIKDYSISLLGAANAARYIMF
ncbi:MAG: glucokinase [Spirochaetia bacterium]